MKKLISFVLPFFLFGCAATNYAVNSFSFDPAKLDTSGVEITCSRNYGQEGVVGHLIQVDDNDFIQVDAYSKTSVYLPAGRHKLKFISIGSPVYVSPVFYVSPKTHSKVYQFGKVSEIEISVSHSKMVNIHYVAPFLTLQKGKIILKNK